MRKSTLPGFTAEVSLYKTRGYYQQRSSRSLLPGDVVSPQFLDQLLQWLFRKPVENGSSSEPPPSTGSNLPRGSRCTNDNQCSSGRCAKDCSPVTDCWPFSWGPFCDTDLICTVDKFCQ